MSEKKRFNLPKSLQGVEIKNGIITSGMKVTKHNVIRILKELNKKSIKSKLRECYDVLRKKVYPLYNAKGVMIEMGKYYGKKADTIRKEIYGKKDLKKKKARGKIE